MMKFLKYALFIIGLIVLVWFILSYKNEVPLKLPADNEPDNTAEVNLDKEIGQMLLVGFRGTSVDKDSSIVKQINELNLGGVILYDFDLSTKSYPWNIASPTQTKKLIGDLRSFSTTTLFVGVDAEGGEINRLKARYGFLYVPSHASLGAGPIERTEKISSDLGLQLKDLGFNMNFAPVVDVNINPSNPIIGALGRSFSGDYLKVIDHAKAFITGQKTNGIISVIKHFPGHGSSRGDSHLGLVDITTTYKPEELNPFRELIKNELVDATMTAHVIDRNVDAKYPATLSPAFMNKLRNDLNFKGVIISDDMQMGAITQEFGFEEAVLRAINSGVNILILSNNTGSYDPLIGEKARSAILKGIRDGRIEKNKIMDSLEKIKLLKEKYGIF